MCWELHGTLIEMVWKWFGHGLDRNKNGCTYTKNGKNDAPMEIKTSDFWWTPGHLLEVTPCADAVCPCARSQLSPGRSNPSWKKNKIGSAGDWKPFCLMFGWCKYSIHILHLCFHIVDLSEQNINESIVSISTEQDLTKSRNNFHTLLVLYLLI